MELGREAAGRQMAAALYGVSYTQAHTDFLLSLGLVPSENIFCWPVSSLQHLLIKPSVWIMLSLRLAQQEDLRSLSEVHMGPDNLSRAFWWALQMSLLPSLHEVMWGISPGHAVDLWIVLTLGKGSLLFAATSATGKNFSFPQRISQGMLQARSKLGNILFLTSLSLLSQGLFTKSEL